MSKCPKCGAKLETISRFCPNCGEAINLSPERLATKQDTPEGVDWIPIVITCFILFHLLDFANNTFSTTLALILIAILIVRFKVLKDGLWHRGVFTPMMVHLTWGVICGFIFYELLLNLWRALFIESIFAPFLLLAPQSISTNRGMLMYFYLISSLITTGIYYLGFKTLCTLYPKSRPQGRAVQVIFALFLFVCAALVRKNSNDLSATLSTNSSTVVPTMDSPVPADAGTAIATTDTSAPSFTNITSPDASQAITSNTVPTDVVTSITPVDSSSQTISVNDNLNQFAGTITSSSNGTTTFTDAYSQYAGMIFPSGQILDALNMPNGRIDENTIFDNMSQVKFTIRDNTIFDSLNQVAYIIDGNTIYDANHQVVATLHK